MLSFFVDKLPVSLSKHVLGKCLTQVVDRQLCEIVLFCFPLKGADTAGTFLFFSSVSSMVPAGKAEPR